MSDNKNTPESNYTLSTNSSERAGEEFAINALNTFNRGGSSWSGGYHAADKRHDMWSVGGYTSEITFEQHLQMYSRCGIARGGIDLDIAKTWQTMPKITDGEGKDSKESLTQFEKDIEWLIKERDFLFRLKELDRKQMVGRYAGLVIVAKQAEASTPDKSLTVGGVQAIHNLIPVYESQLDVNEWVQDITSPDYGQPVVYEFRANAVGDRNDGNKQEQTLHPSRVIAYGGAADGSIYGTPANEAGFNALMDAEKIRIAYSEGGFRQAKGAQVHSIKDSKIAQMLRGSAGDEVRKAYNENVEKFMKGFDNVLNVAGVDVEQLKMDLNNPQEAWMMCVNEYAASRNIPVTILIGQQTGRLASDEDQSHYGQKIMSRRNTDTSDLIKFAIRHLINIGAVAAPENEITVTWDDITEPSIKDKLEMAKVATEIGKNQKEAMGELGDTPIITSEEIRRDILGYDDLPEFETDDFDEGEINE